MGSLEQVDPDVTAAPKAVLLQDTLLVHLHTSLHPCLWALGKGGNCFITGVSLLGMGKEEDLGLGPWAGGRSPALHGHPLLQQLPHQACQGDGPWRAVWGLPGDTGPIRSCWDSARTPRHVGFSGSAALRSLLHYKGQCYMSIPKVPAALLERCYVLKRTATNQVSAGFLLALQVRDPQTAEDLFRHQNLGAL